MANKDDEQEITGQMRPQEEKGYDPASLDAIPTPGAGGAKLGSWGAPAAQPAATLQPQTQPAQPQQAAYDLASLNAIPTPGSGAQAQLGSWGASEPAPQAQPVPQAQPQPAAQQQPAYDLSALDAIPTPGSGRPASPAPQTQPQPAAPQQSAYDLSALNAIPTPGGGLAASPAPQQAPQTQSVSQPRAGAYDLSALEAIPTPQPKQTVDSGVSAKLKVPTGESPNPQQRLRSGNTMDTPVPVLNQGTEQVSERAYPNAPMIPDESPPDREFPMQRVAGILIVITILLAALTVPRMIQQSMKPANSEPDMNKSQMKSFVTDQLKEATPYAR